MQKLFLFVILSLIPYVLFSQNRITIQKKIIERGKVDTISVVGTLSLENSSSIRFLLLFNAYLLDVKKIIGGETFAIRESEPQFSLDITKIDSAILSITSTNFQSINNGIIFQIAVEGLAYKDSITYIIPAEIVLDDSPVDFQKDSGMVIVRGPSVIPVAVTTLGYAYPFPTENPLKFSFTLAKKTQLDFAIFAMNGKKILSSNDNFDFFSIFKGTTKIPLNSIFEPGEYTLSVALPKEIATGVYFLRMNTAEFGPFYSKFLILK